MVQIPVKENSTVNTIEIQETVNNHRSYLGASQIGHSCPRYLWYSFRWAYKSVTSARMSRLFARGHREEPEIVKMLATAGIQYWGDQTEIVFCYGHGKGHCDGMCSGVIEAPKTVHLTEFKALNDKGFKKMVKSKCKSATPKYFAQCQIYMKFLNLTRTLFVVINKNDDNVYLERIKYDKDIADKLVRKAESIVLAEAIPDKPYSPTWYECKWCDANFICHGNDEPEINCRTCQHIDIENEGKWACSKHDLQLSTSQQRLGCKQYTQAQIFIGG